MLEVEKNKQFTRLEFESVLKNALERPSLFQLQKGQNQSRNGCLSKKDSPIFGARECPVPSRGPMLSFIESLVGTWKGTSKEDQVTFEMFRPTAGNVRNKGNDLSGLIG